jgi:uncharacterized protein YkwD
MAKRLRLTAAVLLAAGALIVPGRAASQVSIEYQLLSLVNGGRSGSLVMHSGLVGAARSHSQRMAASGSLSHAGARSRVTGAAPDPSESNGAPDDGFTGTWCENIAYVSGGSAGDVASRIYSGWRGSSTHLHCMTDPGMSAVGMGVHFDGETWWATMDAFGDKTLPGDRAASEPAVPAPAIVAPQATQNDEPAETAVPRPKADLQAAAPRPRVPASDRSPLAWPEIVAAIGIIGVSLFSYRHFSRVQASR